MHVWFRRSGSESPSTSSGHSLRGSSTLCDVDDIGRVWGVVRGEFRPKKKSTEKERSSLTGRLACRLLAVDNFTAAARLARELPLIVLILFEAGHTHRSHTPGVRCKLSEIAAAA